MINEINRISTLEYLTWKLERWFQFRCTAEVLTSNRRFVTRILRVAGSHEHSPSSHSVFPNLKAELVTFSIAGFERCSASSSESRISLIASHCCGDIDTREVNSHCRCGVVEFESTIISDETKYFHWRQLDSLNVMLVCELTAEQPTASIINMIRICSDWYTCS